MEGEKNSRKDDRTRKCFGIFLDFSLRCGKLTSGTYLQRTGRRKRESDGSRSKSNVQF